MAEDAITLTFDPFQLPMAQHRAGLGGLLLEIETLEQRGIGPLPTVTRDDEGRYQIVLTEEGLGVLFNDLYDAVTLEQPSKTKRKGKDKQPIEPQREEQLTNPKTGKKETIYYYPQLVPRAAFLQALQVPDAWIRLWASAMWATVRGVPMTRTPYEERVRGEGVSETAKTWKALNSFQRNRQRGKANTESLAGCLMLGCQATNAENVPFKGRADENFLLHFWPVVVGVYRPQAIDREGRAEPTGYVLTVPDVTDFAGFLTDFRGMVGSLDPAVSGYTPRNAIISIPEEAALEYAAGIAAVARARASDSVLAFSTAAVEVYHLDKRGNSIPVLFSGRVTLSPELLNDYEQIRHRYHHPLFHRQLILNLLRGSPWYAGFDGVFARNPKNLFLGGNGWQFQLDLHRKMRTNKESITNA